jgi:phosphoribosylglycinamide formyltransferase-1
MISLYRVATSDQPLRVGVLVSGSGSNLQALLDAQRAAESAAHSRFRVVVVVANVVGAFAVERAARAGVAAVVLPHTSLAREEHEARVAAALVEHDVELVVLAGYMRVLTASFVGRFPRRIVIVHPAVLRAFPGLHGARLALEHGCRIAGCTVHLVDDGVDTGAILAQAAVAVADDDTEESLQKRIQAEEHRLLPQVVAACAAGQVGIDERGRVRLRSNLTPAGAA